MNDPKSATDLWLSQTPVVVVTGATRGIGRALALALGEAGATLVLHGRNADALQAIAREVHAAGAAAVGTCLGDLRDADLGAKLVAAAAHFEGANALVLNASILGTMGPLCETSDADIDAVLAIGVAAQVRLYRAFAPSLRAGGRAAVIWLSSGLGRFGVERFGMYCASKHAIEGLAKVAALEDAPFEVVHVPMAPGMVQTQMLASAMEGADITGHETAERTGRGFAAFLKVVNPAHSGQSLDIEPWLP